jgi:serine protease Do
MSAIDLPVASMLSLRFSPRLSVCFLLQAVLFAAGVCFAQSPYEKSALVRVNVINELRWPNDALVIKGHLLDEYNPTVIQKFSSPGVVLDADGHIMTFLGYGRIFVEKESSRFEIPSSDGKLYKGNLIGIDYGNGAAVVQVPEGKLVKTSICLDCVIRAGDTLLAPVFIGSGLTQFQSTRVMSIQSRGVAQERAGLVVRMNRPFLDVGQPFFTNDNRVLGFVVSQDPSGVSNVVYTVSDLLNSSRKIIEKSGDIRTGWLGVYYPADDVLTPYGPGVRIEDVVKDGPAQKAGLVASDVVLRYNGEKVGNVLEFTHRVQDTPLGSTVALEVLRGGRLRTLSAVIQERKYRNPLQDMKLNLQDPFGPPLAQMTPESAQAAQRPRIGFETVVLTPQLADFLQIRVKTGLLVVNVVRQSSADQAGLKQGDVILSINENSVADAQKLSAFLQSLGPGSVVSVKVLRKDSEQVIDVRLPQ